MSRWFRFYDEALDDPKVQRLSGEMFKAWVNLLALASKNNGKLPSADDISFRLRISVQDAQQRLDELILAGLIDILPDKTLTPHNWQNRQFASDSSASRMQKHRAKKHDEKVSKNKTKSTCDVTCDGGDEKSDAIDSDTDTDTDSETNTEAAAESELVPARVPQPAAALPSGKVDLKNLETRLFDACNGSLDNPVNCMGLLNLSVPQMWLEQGCDLERDVIPTLQAAGKKYHGKRIRDWNYFSGMVAEAKAKRERGLPDVATGGQIKTAPQLPAWRQEKLDRYNRLMGVQNA